MGGGGGARVAGADGGGGGGPDGLRDVGGGGSLPGAGGGGGARGGGTSGALVAGAETVDEGREAGRGGGLFRPATKGFTGGTGGDSVEGGRGGGLAPGGLGAVGGLGAGAAGGRRAPSESDMYGESRVAPVSTPPRLRNLGIPPAKIPPNWGGVAAAAPSNPETPSLLLRNRLAAGPEGTGGASPLGGGLAPGTGGALAMGGAAELPPDVPTTGADRSLVTAFFNLAPLWISERSAPYSEVSYGVHGRQASSSNGNL